MMLEPNCAVCGSLAWNEVEEREYSNYNIPIDDYSRVRYQVLFELWFPGSTTVKLQSILCRQCGFLCYRPRPEALDIEKKYTFLAEHEQAKIEFSVEKKSDASRSQELFRYLRKRLKGKPSSILDYGGGNGRLLRHFVEAGHDCSTLELVDQTLPGIKYAGSQISDLSHRSPFDVLICSHVLEHLANPLEILTELVPHIHPDGLVYVEVPSEIWHRAPPTIDPVTHINFFTTDSLRALLEMAGLEVSSCRYQTFTRPNCEIGIAIKAVAKRSTQAGDAVTNLPGPNLVYSQLQPSFIQRVGRLIRNPRILLNLIHRKNLR